MAFRRSVALAYGIPGGSTIVLGGENRGFQLQTHDIMETYDQLSVSGAFSVHGAGSTPAARSQDIKTNIDAFQYLYTHSGDLTLSSDTEREFTASFATSSPTATITDTGGGSFSSADVGRLISVEAIGTWRIESVGGTSCTVRLLPGVTVPADNAATNARVLNTIFQTKEATRERGYHGRVVVAPETSPLDTKHRMTFSFEINFEKAAIDARDDGRRAASISTKIDSSRRRGVIVTGVYTGVAGTDAVATHAANFEAWKATVLADWPSTDFEDLGTEINFDDEKALVAFSNVSREFRIEESIGAIDKDDPDLSNQSLTLTRRSPAGHGVPGLVTPPTVEVTYSAMVRNGVDTSTWRTSLYEGKILPHIINRVKDAFGSGTIVLLEDLVTFDEPSGVISVFLMVQLNLGNTSTLLKYRRMVMMSLSMNKSVRNRWNKKKHSYSTFSPTESISARVVVTETRRGPPVYANREIIGVNQAPTGEDFDVTGQDAWVAPPVPQFPPELVENFGENEWIFLNASITNSYGYAGKNANTSLAGLVRENDLVTNTDFVSSWLWGNEVVDELVTNDSSPGLGDELSFEEQLLRGVSEGDVEVSGITLSRDPLDT